MNYLRLRCFSSRGCNQMLAKAIPKNMKGKGTSSQMWLSRQLSDPYVEKARIMNYRCRSAFKLLEINEKYGIIKPGDVIIDCGAAPGSWTQVAVEHSNANEKFENKPKGMVISMDLLHFHNVPGAIIYGGMDLTKPVSQQRIRDTLEGRQVNCILSDMAPNATGVKTLDQEKIIDLCYNVLKFAVTLSASKGHLLMKVWDNAEVSKLETSIKHFYDNVKRIKPRSSRSDSAEFFILARNYKGLLNTTSSTNSLNPKPV